MTPQQTSTGILELRRKRKRIRTTLNLVGDGQRITEKPGSWWKANMETRQVEWTPTLPFSPFSQIDDDAIRVLCAHESSHIKWSGLYTVKRIPTRQAGMFHRFVNAIEDIRVDRLSTRQFAGFGDAMVTWRLQMRAMHGNHPQGWCLVDAVGMNAKFSLELGLDPEGTDLAQAASIRLWPRLTRIANLRSTQEVATALEPIFLELVQIEQAEADRKRREEEERQRAEEQARQEAEEQRQREAEEERQRQAEEEERQLSEDAEDSEDDAGSEQNGDPSAGAESEDDQADGEKDDEAEESEGRGGGSAPDQASAPDDEDGDEGGDAEPDAEGVDDPADDSGSGAGGQDGEDEPAHDGHDDGEQADDGDEAGQDDDHAAEDTDGSGEPEPEEEPDPLGGLDSLPNAGADEPTDTPIQSDGDAGTEPLGIGEELKGMAQDAVDSQAASELERSARTMQVKKQQAAADVLKQLGQRTHSTPLGRQRYDEKLTEWRGKINVLALRLKTVLRHNSMANPLTGQRRGRFDPGKAYRLRTGSIHVFTKPGTIGGLDYTFGLLVDTSDSMFPVESQGAFDATVLVAEALEQAGLGVFLVFWDKELKHVKPIAEPLAAHRGSVGTLLGGADGGMDTIESPALSWAIDQFEGVSGKRMLITITDGITRTIAESKELLAELEKLDVRTCTIRIGDEAPAEHYERGFRIDHASELTRLLPQLINEVVTRAA